LASRSSIDFIWANLPTAMAIDSVITCWSARSCSWFTKSAG